jgi:hypothetical protein
MRMYGISQVMIKLLSGSCCRVDNVVLCLRSPLRLLTRVQVGQTGRDVVLRRRRTLLSHCHSVLWYTRNVGGKKKAARNVLGKGSDERNEAEEANTCRCSLPANVGTSD